MDIEKIGGITWIDGLVIILMMAAVTFIGHRLSGGGAASRKSFFTADGGLPWWAVASSLYVTVISASTFISVPGSVFKDGGNLTYFQVVLAVMLGKFLIAFFFVKPFYEAENIDSIYDYFSLRLDGLVSHFAMILSIIFSFLVASIALLATALALSTIMQWSIPLCIALIVIASVIWSGMGGLKTVIWTDFMLFIIFLAGAIFSIIWVSASLDLPFNDVVKELDSKAKTVIFDFSIDPKIRYTVWASLFGATFVGMLAGAQQVGFQRIKACRSVSDARLAYYASAGFYVVQVLLLMVGLALAIFYFTNPLPVDAAAQIAEKPDRIFPYFVITELPPGVAGLFIGAIFAAGISTVDSRLAELSDISVTNIYQRYVRSNASEKHYIFVARVALGVWGLVFGIVAYLLSNVEGEGLLDLGFRFPNYASGAILGTAILAVLGVGSYKSFFPAVVCAIASTFALDHIGVSFFWWMPSSITILVGGVWFAETILLRKRSANHG